MESHETHICVQVYTSGDCTSAHTSLPLLPVQLIGHWESEKMDLSELEDVLGKDLHILCYPLSIIIRKYDNISCMNVLGKKQ